MQAFVRLKYKSVTKIYGPMHIQNTALVHRNSREFEYFIQGLMISCKTSTRIRFNGLTGRLINGIKLVFNRANERDNC